MKLDLKPAELEIPEDDPFAHDALGRKPSAEVLTQFVRRISDPYVLTVDAPWGSGKTTFLRMWHQHLKNEGLFTFRFNAWETDFASDPFIALVGEFEHAVNEHLAGDSAVTEGLRTTKTLAVRITKRAIPVAVRLATAGILDLDKDLEAALGDFAGKVAKDKLAEYDTTRDTMLEFKKSLATMVETITKSSNYEAPFVFFVDELDRCRPTYAIEFLERAKHFFSVPGIVFVLALDQDQLSHSIRAVYGSEFDARGYLRRFLDMDYRLPVPVPGNYARHLFDRLGVSEYFQANARSRAELEKRYLCEFLEFFIDVLELSLREQIQLVSRVLVILNTIPDDHQLFAQELAIMTVLREWKPSLFNGYQTGAISHRDIMAALSSASGGHKFKSSRESEDVEAVLAAGADEIAGTQDILHQYEQIVADDAAESWTRKRAEGIRDYMLDSARPLKTPGMKHTLNRIALSQAFVVRSDEEQDQAD